MQSPETRSGVVGVGEIADLIRARDWSATPLGATAVWSGEFLSIVNMITTLPVPALVYWGPNAILLYNEAARPILRTDHPGALGVSAREALPGSWHAMGPDAESVSLRPSLCLTCPLPSDL